MELVEVDDYKKKVQRAIKLLQSIPQDEEIELSYSGGKDSDVILELAKMAGIPFRAIYKNTTIDPKGTIKHCKSKGVEIVQPKRSFFGIIEYAGAPSRFRRVCCSYLKEYKILNRAIQGIRRSESTKRAKRYKEPEYCRVYNKKEKVKIYLPILDWTDADVDRFIKERNIQCHPHYYDENGNFRVERRLGCIGCPLKSDKGKLDYTKYPQLLKMRIKAQQKFIDTHPNTKTAARFKNAYESTYFQLFCENMAEFKTKTTPDLWGDELDCKKALEEYFKIEL